VIGAIFLIWSCDRYSILFAKNRIISMMPLQDLLRDRVNSGDF